MRDRVIGAVGGLWGGFLLLRAYSQYAHGGAFTVSFAQIVSLVFALLFLVGGLDYVFKPRAKAGTSA
jgi:hypothetical protein